MERRELTRQADRVKAGGSGGGSACKYRRDTGGGWAGMAARRCGTLAAQPVNAGRMQVGLGGMNDACSSSTEARMICLFWIICQEKPDIDDTHLRHCEERSDEAIQRFNRFWIASQGLAMTKE
jgi:hypothetical protein